MSAAKPRGPLPLARLIGSALDPVISKRGFAASDLIVNWDTIVGPRYAAFTRPEKLSWPRGKDGKGVLTVHVEGARGIFLQHETEQFIDRINGYLGFGAVGDIRIVQRPMQPKKTTRRTEPRPLPADERAVLDKSLEGVESDRLREALARLGEGIIGDRLARE